MHCTRANCELQRARERAGERRLADAGQVLEEDVALGGDADEHLVEQLAGGPRRRPSGVARCAATSADGGRRARSRRRGRDLRCWPSVEGDAHREAPALCRCAVRRAQIASTVSSTARATSAFDVRGDVALAACGDDRHLVLDALEADVLRAPMSLTTTASRPLRGRACRGRRRRRPRRARRRSRRASGPGGARPASALRMSSVRSSVERERRRCRSFLSFVVRRLGRAEVGDGGGHEQDVARGELAPRTRPAARRRSRRRRSGCAGCARRPTLAATTVTSRAERGGLLGQREAHPPGASGCRRSAPRRSARACRRR